MHVEDPLREVAGKILAEDAHEAGQNDQVDLLPLQELKQSGLKALLPAAVLPQQGHGGDARLPGPLQSVSLRLVGHHQANVPALDNAAFLRVDQGLEIGAAAGDENRDSCLQHMRTLSWLSTTWPMA